MKKPFNISEYFKIKQRIEECDAFYAALYNLANVEYSNEVSTACITFDKQGNSLDMKINPEFWSDLNEDAKTFVVLHELYHVVYDHGKRIMALGGDFALGNEASDIVINHHIHEKVGVHREGFDWQRFCWVETCFPNEKDVPTDKSFEYYYNKLSKKSEPSNKELLGSHGNGEENNNQNQQQNGQSQPKKEEEKEEKKQDTGQGEPKEDKEDKEDAGNEFAPSNFSDIFKDIIEQNPELADEIAKSPDFAQLGDELKEHLPIHPKLGKGHEGKDADFVKSQNKPTFHKLMKLLVPKKKDQKDNDLEVWIGSHRRYASFLKQNSHIMLPNIREEEIFSGKDKKEVWIFMDSSGSCHGMFHTFSNIVMALLKQKGVNCRAFAFGDDCKEVDVKNHKIGFYSGNAGGFDCIEERILSTMKKEKIKYPDNIVVLSDGGVSFEIRDSLKNPKNWILLINNDHCHHLTPPGGKYFKVDKSFFGLDKNKEDNNKHKMKF
jgi:predicted SprT family Zn-dependent metalloprotease